jgi:hypothetical protein
VGVLSRLGMQPQDLGHRALALALLRLLRWVLSEQVRSEDATDDAAREAAPLHRLSRRSRCDRGDPLGGLGRGLLHGRPWRGRLGLRWGLERFRWWRSCGRDGAGRRRSARVQPLGELRRLLADGGDVGLGHFHPRRLRCRVRGQRRAYLIQRQFSRDARVPRPGRWRLFLLRIHRHQRLEPRSCKVVLKCHPYRLGRKQTAGSPVDSPSARQTLPATDRYSTTPTAGPASAHMRSGQREKCLHLRESGPMALSPVRVATRRG